MAQHTGFYSTTYSGLDSSVHVNGFLSESDKDFPSSTAMKLHTKQLLLTWWRTGCDVRRWDNMKQISHLAFRESSSSSTTDTSDEHKHNWIAAVCLTVRESVCYVLSSYRLQMVDEEMARIRVNCSPEHLRKINERMENLESNLESSQFHCHMWWVVLSCWDKRTEKREEQIESRCYTKPRIRVFPTLSESHC